MTILFTERAQQYAEEFEICSATVWPRLPQDNIMVSTNQESCKIKMLSVRYIDTYTTAVFFSVYVNSSCRYIIIMLGTIKARKETH